LKKDKKEMKTTVIIVVMLFVIFLSTIPVSAQESIKDRADFSGLKGEYLGQKPPRITPELFADGILANKYRSFHSSLMFSKNGEECYWQARLSGRESALVYSKMENENWTSPEIVSFSRIEYKDDCPFVSPDGKALFFISRRPIEKGIESNKENIWVVKKTSSGWGAPEPLPQIINSMSIIHWQISVDRQKNLYFSTYQMESSGRRGDIYCSKILNGEYAEPVKLGPNINTSDYEFSPFISPDNSYIIFSREKYGEGSCRLFISFSDEKGDWAEAKDLNEWHGIKGICPIVSKDEKYLFFLDYVNSFTQPFWTDAKFIEELRQK
jgi:WD40 repeat protein